MSRIVPPARLKPVLPLGAVSDGDAATFFRDGFLRVEELASPGELERLRAICDRLFAQRAGWEQGDWFDMVSADDLPTKPRLPQLAWPSRYAPELRDMPFQAMALDLARRILGPQAELMWEFAILKPPRDGAATPWHQDEASFTVGTPFRVSVSVCVPLQDVTEESGCMRYVPGSHLGPLLTHVSVHGDKRVHALEALGVDEAKAKAISVPMRAGEAVLHHSRTIHGAGPNRSEAPRRAYIMNFAVRSHEDTVRKDFPWNVGKRTARDEREARATPLRRRLRLRLRHALLRLGLR